MTAEAPVVVAVVSDAVAPFNKGGKEARIDALTQRLADHGVEVHLHTMRWWRDGRPTYRHGRVLMHALSPLVPLYSGARRSIRQGLVFSASSVRMLTRRYDVLEADAIPFLHLFPLRLVASLRRKPLVVTWHEVWGPAYWRSYLGPLGVVAAACERFAVSLPDHIVAASEGTAERLHAVSRGRARVTVVPNGIDRREIDAAPEPERGCDLVAVGRLLRHKNVHVVLDALALLRARGRDLTLQVIGEGPEREPLEAQARALGVDDLVQFRGALEDRVEVLSAIKGASVLAFPSEREGFGMVALESLACGTPVITSDHPDNFARVLVSDDVDGYVRPATPEAVADAVAAALDDLPRLREAALTAASDYDWDAIAAHAAKVYRS